MTFEAPPPSAAFRHGGAREGFEVAFFSRDGDGHRVEGHAAAVEEGEAWSSRYVIALDARWRTRRARVWGHSAGGAREVLLEADGAGRWRVDGAPVPELEGCLDVDLEASALTNAFPVRRLALAVGRAADAPAAYVRALGLGVSRLEQRYARVPHQGPGEAYDYVSPSFSFACRLVYDRSGLVVDYPGIAVRAR